MVFEKIGDNISDICKGKDFLYKRKGIHFRSFDTLPKAEVCTVVLEYYDNAANYITVLVNGKAAAAAAGYTCCNSKRVRKGVFLYTLSSDDDLQKETNIEVFGASEIIKVYLKAGKDEVLISEAKKDRVLPIEVKTLFDL